MAHQLDHIELASTNQRTLDYLLRSDVPHLEWVVTVAFYKALHIAEAVFDAHAGRHSMSHDDRNKTLKTTTFGSLFIDYKHLYDASRTARYLINTSGASAFSTFADYLPEDKARKLIKKRLFGFEQHALHMLSEEAKTSLHKFDPERV